MGERGDGLVHHDIHRHARLTPRTSIRLVEPHHRHARGNSVCVGRLVPKLGCELAWRPACTRSRSPVPVSGLAGCRSGRRRARTYQYHESVCPCLPNAALSCAGRPPASGGVLSVVGKQKGGTYQAKRYRLSISHESETMGVRKKGKRLTPEARLLMGPARTVLSSKRAARKMVLNMLQTKVGKKSLVYGAARSSGAGE